MEKNDTIGNVIQLKKNDAPADFESMSKKELLDYWRQSQGRAIELGRRSWDEVVVGSQALLEIHARLTPRQWQTFCSKDLCMSARNVGRYLDVGRYYPLAELLDLSTIDKESVEAMDLPVWNVSRFTRELGRLKRKAALLGVFEVENLTFEDITTGGPFPEDVPLRTSRDKVYKPIIPSELDAASAAIANIARLMLDRGEFEVHDPARGALETLRDEIDALLNEGHYYGRYVDYPEGFTVEGEYTSDWIDTAPHYPDVHRAA